MNSTRPLPPYSAVSLNGDLSDGPGLSGLHEAEVKECSELEGVMAKGGGETPNWRVLGALEGEIERTRMGQGFSGLRIPD